MSRAASNSSLRRLCRLLGSTLAAALLAGTAAAAPNGALAANAPQHPPLTADAPPVTTNTTASGDPVDPTVTVEMGDVGGKYFGHAPDPAKTKHYYIAAEPVLWNFAPDGADPVCGKTFPNSLLLKRVAWKIRYVQYADPNFTQRVLQPQRLGILGPVLRGTVGQYIEVTFLNRAWLPLSMHPHGVRYDKDSEGTYYKDGSGLGAAIAPGAKFTYVWYMAPNSGPLPGEASSQAWLYHSHVGGDDDTQLGLIGSIIVTDPARARPDGTPRDVDREMEALFMIFDGSDYVGTDADEPDERSTAASANEPAQPTWAQAQEFAEESQRHTINGLAFGNLHGLDINQGERVRWYLFGLGSESDLHAAHWHGTTVVEDGERRTDVVELLPGSMKVADMVADNPGDWLFHCHVAEHMANGMFARVSVHGPKDPPVSRAPEIAFLGMPQSLATLHLQTAEISLDKKNRDNSEIDLAGEVTVPDPFPVARNAFTVQLGGSTLTLHPDASGICSTPAGILLIKNLSTYGNGIVRNGTLNFELTLRGAAWLEELQKMHLLQKDTLARHATLALSVSVGNVQHSSSAAINVADDAPSAAAK